MAAELTSGHKGEKRQGICYYLGVDGRIEAQLEGGKVKGRAGAVRLDRNGRQRGKSKDGKATAWEKRGEADGGEDS